jgi:hypothetical protein
MVPGNEVDQSPTSSAEVKNAHVYTSTPQCLHGVAISYGDGPYLYFGHTDGMAFSDMSFPRSVLPFTHCHIRDHASRHAVFHKQGTEHTI